MERDWRGRGDERTGDSAEGRGSGPVHERGPSAERVTIVIHVHYSFVTVLHAPRNSRRTATSSASAHTSEATSVRELRHARRDAGRRRPALRPRVHVLHERL